jgi:ubiquinone/menaquinone biosynthesis C-methylase UbiE
MTGEYISVTEISGDQVTQEQIERLCNRYYWAGQYCSSKDVVEVACGTGQGLRYLSRIARCLKAGDYSNDILSIARQHYGDLISLSQFDAQDMPFPDKSNDVIILFEAIYYIADAEKFVSECVRILRPGGKVLIVTANKDLYDFNPSPYSHKYYGVCELNDLFKKFGFKPEFYGDTPVNNLSMGQQMLRLIKKIVIKFGLMPKTMAGKKFLKRIVFGNLVTMPAEIDTNTSKYIEPTPLLEIKPDRIHKVIYCAATNDYSD